MIDILEFLSVPVWLGWATAAVVFVLVDLVFAGAQLFLVGAAIGAGAAAIAATLGTSLEVQAWVMLIGTVLATPTILMLRPRGKTNIGPREARWAEGRVTEVIEWNGRIGVRLEGDFFNARDANGNKPELGKRVRVERMEGITAIVTDVIDSEQPKT